MNKLRLKLEDLAVESFDLNSGDYRLRGGTVHAQQCEEGGSNLIVASQGCGGETDTQLASCDPNASITCGGCNGGGNSGMYTCDVTCNCGAGTPTDYAGCNWNPPPPTPYCSQYCLTGYNCTLYCS